MQNFLHLYIFLNSIVAHKVLFYLFLNRSCRVQWTVYRFPSGPISIYIFHSGTMIANYIVLPWNCLHFFQIHFRQNIHRIGCVRIWLSSNQVGVNVFCGDEKVRFSLNDFLFFHISYNEIDVFTHLDRNLRLPSNPWCPKYQHLNG